MLYWEYELLNISTYDILIFTLTFAWKYKYICIMLKNVNPPIKNLNYTFFYNFILEMLIFDDNKVSIWINIR